MSPVKIPMKDILKKSPGLVTADDGRPVTSGTPTYDSDTSSTTGHPAIDDDGTACTDTALKIYNSYDDLKQNERAISDYHRLKQYIEGAALVLE